MKNKIIGFCFVLLCYCSATAQTSADKNNVSAGFGFQQYTGNLGNTLFNFEYEWYGVFRASYSRYLNSSVDANIVVTTGDFGHCHNDDDNNIAGPDNSPILEFRVRLTTISGILKYKFANNYLLKENSKFAPFIDAGVAINFLRDIWGTTPRGNLGNYMTINAGLGCSYNLTQKIQLTYNMGFGYFTSNAITFDYSSNDTRDMYMQNSLSIGFNI